MASVNKVILVGNLGQDPELRHAPNGDAICNISVATTDSWKDKTTGEKKEQTEWHRVSFFGRLAEIADQYLRKGSAVYIEGSFAPSLIVDGRKVTPAGWMWILGFALGGCEWAVIEASKPEFRALVADWLRERKRAEAEMEIEALEQRIANIRASIPPNA